MPLAVEFLLLAALWGSSFLFMMLGAAEFGPWATAGLRVSVAAAALLPLLLLAGHWRLLRTHAGAIFVSGLLSSALPFALFAWALLSISTGLSAILNATTPLFGALVAWLWLRERLPAGRALGLAVGFAGVLLLSWPKADFAGGGTGWAVLACLGAWGAVVAVGLLCSALAYLLFFRLIARAGASKALTVTFLIPVFALIYGALLLGEAITLSMVAGGGVILLGVLLATGALRWPAPQRSENQAQSEP